jgi:DNA-binding transcriptional LysR family regulator
MALNLKKLDLNLLVIFESVYSTQNISRAATRLAMSQPAVSNALARLRDVLDDPLFVRAPRGVEPTVRARELIIPVREALGLINRQIAASGDIDLASYKRNFRVIISDNLEAMIMPAIARTLIADAPGISIECVQGDRNFAEDVRSGKIDVACFPFPIDTTDIVTRPICPLDIVVVSRRDHPGIARPLDLDTFCALPQIALGRELRGITNIDKALVAKGMQRHVVYMAAKLWSIPPMVEQTDLIGMLPRRFVETISGNYRLDTHEVPTGIETQHAYMMWHINSEHDAGHRWLRESMMQAALSN